MKLRDRFAFKRQENGTAAVPAAPAVVSRSRMSAVEKARQELKLRIHRDLLQRIDLTQLGDKFWNNVETSGFDVVPTQADGVTLPIFDLNGFDVPTRAGTVRISGANLGATFEQLPNKHQRGCFANVVCSRFESQSPDGDFLTSYASVKQAEKLFHEDTFLRAVYRVDGS